MLIRKQQYKQVPANGIHSYKPSTESVRQQKAFTKSVADDWPRAKSEQKVVKKCSKSIAEDWPETVAQIRGVFASCIKVVRYATKRQNAFLWV